MTSQKNYYGHTREQEELADTFDELRAAINAVERFSPRRADELRTYLRDVLEDEVEHARAVYRRERRRSRGFKT